jgi:hypothetical protein
MFSETYFFQLYQLTLNHLLSISLASCFSILNILVLFQFFLISFMIYYESLLSTSLGLVSFPIFSILYIAAKSFLCNTNPIFSLPYSIGFLGDSSMSIKVHTLFCVPYISGNRHFSFLFYRAMFYTS